MTVTGTGNLVPSQRLGLGPGASPGAERRDWALSPQPEAGAEGDWGLSPQPEAGTEGDWELSPRPEAGTGDSVPSRRLGLKGTGDSVLSRRLGLALSPQSDSGTPVPSPALSVAWTYTVTTPHQPPMHQVRTSRCTNTETARD